MLLEVVEGRIIRFFERNCHLRWLFEKNKNNILKEKMKIKKGQEDARQRQTSNKSGQK